MSPARGRLVPRAALSSDPLEVAHLLLNKVLVVGEAAGRIVEVEAYGGADDPASHGHRRRTARNAVMFGPPGHLYVYFTYGMHWCANVTCRPDGEAAAVLVRALAPVRGIDLMRHRRPTARRDADLCSGPAKLTAALGIDRALDGADLTTRRSAAYLVDDATPPPPQPLVTGRIGISVAQELPWRLAVDGDPNLSRRS